MKRTLILSTNDIQELMLLIMYSSYEMNPEKHMNLEEKLVDINNMCNQENDYKIRVTIEG